MVGTLPPCATLDNRHIDRFPQEVVTMATTLACADLGADCVATFTTEDADELMAHAALHAQRVHPELDLTPELVAQANTVMRQT